MNGKLKVYSLSLDLDVNSLYSDYPVSKRQLAALLGCSRTSVHTWCDFAWINSPDFRAETPQSEDGEYLKDAPLSGFQVWLVSRVQFLMLRLRSQERAAQYLAANKGLFSRGRFSALMEVINREAC